MVSGPSGGLLVAVAICSHAFGQGNVVGRCSLSRRAERPARAGARGLGGSDYTFRVDATDGAKDSFALCLWTGAEVPHPRVGTTDNQVPLASGTVRMTPDLTHSGQLSVPRRLRSGTHHRARLLMWHDPKSGTAAPPVGTGRR